MFFIFDGTPQGSSSLPLAKRPGDPTTATVSFTHVGQGGRFQVGFGIALAQRFGHGPESFAGPFLFGKSEDVPPHVAPIPVTVFLDSKPWPSDLDAPRGRYDAFKFVDMTEGRQIFGDWDDDVFEVR